jgi:phosphoribosylanthranilate isomerase
LEEVVAAVDPDMIQLHGSETPERTAAIAESFKRPVLKAVKVATAADAQAALSYGAADLILFDAKAPEDRPGALPGGNGVAFDWQVLEGVRGKLAYMLAGGLTPLNVAEAIRLTGATAVDVSSGVESRPGEKDVELIRRFLHAAKTANDIPSPRRRGEG